MQSFYFQGSSPLFLVCFFFSTARTVNDNLVETTPITRGVLIQHPLCNLFHQETTKNLQNCQPLREYTEIDSCQDTRQSCSQYDWGSLTCFYYYFFNLFIFCLCNNQSRTTWLTGTWQPSPQNHINAFKVPTWHSQNQMGFCTIIEKCDLDLKCAL